MANTILSAFLDGLTGGTLFTQARLPGEPTHLFADEESECQQSELVASLLDIQERENQEAKGSESTSLVVSISDPDFFAPEDYELIGIKLKDASDQPDAPCYFALKPKVSSRRSGLPLTIGLAQITEDAK